MAGREQEANELIRSITKMMEQLPQSSSDNSIFERACELPGVNNRLFQAHEPKLVAFGFSHCRPNADMTKNKVVYLKQLVERRHKKDKEYVQQFVKAILELKAEIYSCYDNSDIQRVCHQDSDIDRDHYSPRCALVKIIFDACFILELVYKCSEPSFIETNDPIFRRGQNLQNIVRDMFVLSNQVPLFLLQEFFELTAEEHNSSSFTEKFVSFIEKALCIGPIHIGASNMNDAKHLLAFTYDIWVNSSEFGNATHMEVQRSERQLVIRNATELKRAGVRFRSVKAPTFDLKFRHGVFSQVLEIPVLSITTETECFLQNIIAYEQSFQDNKMLVVSDYCVLMDCLIQSRQDVQLLRENGVIQSYLHDDKDIVSLFDRLGKRVPSSTHFCYSDLFHQLNKHCVRRWNSCKAKFRRDYLRDDKQLEAMSFMFALYIILPVTVVQTAYTILSYYKGSGK